MFGGEVGFVDDEVDVVVFVDLEFDFVVFDVGDGFVCVGCDCFGFWVGYEVVWVEYFVELIDLVYEFGG